MTFKDVIKYSARRIRDDIKYNANDFKVAFTHPFFRVGKTFKQIGIYIKDYKTTQFYEAHREDIEAIWAPMEKTRLKTQNPGIRHDYYHMGLNNRRWARGIYTLSISELENRIATHEANKKSYYSESYEAVRDAMNIALEIARRRKSQDFQKAA